MTCINKKEIEKIKKEAEQYRSDFCPTIVNNLCDTCLDLLDLVTMLSKAVKFYQDRYEVVKGK